MNLYIPYEVEPFRILWVGKFDFRKQFDLALEAVSQIKDLGASFEFHVVSPFASDTQRNSLLLKIEQKGLKDKVILYGRVTNSKVHNLMHISQVLLFTSIMEGTPHVVLEAIQNGLPVICHDTCGQGDVVTDRTGIKIPLTSSNSAPAAFAKAISNLLANPDRLQAMKQATYGRQQDLSWNMKAKNMLVLYEAY